MSRSVPFEDPLLHPSTPPIEPAAAPTQQLPPSAPTKQVDDGPIPFGASPSAGDVAIFSPPPFHSAAVSSRAATPSATPIPTTANVASAPAFEDPLQSAFGDHLEKNQPPAPPPRQQAPSPNIGIPSSNNNMPTEFPTHLASPPLPQRPPSLGGTSFSAFQAFSTLQPPTESGTPVSTSVSGAGTPIQVGSSSTIPLNNDSALSLPPPHLGNVGLGLGTHDQTMQQSPSGAGTGGQWGNRRLSMGVSTNPSGIMNSQDMPDMVQQELKSPQHESEGRHHPLSETHQGFSSLQQERQTSPIAQQQLYIKPTENHGREHSGLRSPSIAVPLSPMRPQGFPILNTANMFHEINMADAMNDLMVRHIPAEHRALRDWGALTEAEQRQASRSEILHELTINNSWRAMTRYTRSQILATPSDKIVDLINLWYARLLALTKLGQYEMAQAEMDQLGDLRGPQYRFESYPAEVFSSSPDFQTNEQRQGGSRKKGSIVPFEFLVLRARLQGYLGDIYEAIDQFYDLILLCKKFEAICRVGEDVSGERQWLDLSGQLHLMVLNYLIELKDYPAATKHARDLAKRYPHDINFHSGLGRLYLQLGDLDRAQNVFQGVEDLVKALPVDGNEQSHLKLQLTMNRALLAVATGEWISAKNAFEEVLIQEPENLVATNNLAVCELYAGQLNEAIPRIEKLMFAYPTSAGTSEPLVFNMATLYELRTEGSMKKKQQMLVEVSQWAGDQFNVGVFKI